MKQQYIALSVVLIWANWACCQDLPMRLAPVETEDVGIPPAETEIDQFDADDPTLRLDRQPDSSEKLPREGPAPVIPAPTVHLPGESESQISTLLKPLSQIQLSGLASSTNPPPSGLEMTEVSQLRFTDAPPQLITATGLGDLSAFETITTYTRRRLYFQDAPLERWGQSGAHFPPGVWTNGRSAAKFLIDTALMPYRMVKNHPDELVRATAE